MKQPLQTLTIASALATALIAAPSLAQQTGAVVFVEAGAQQSEQVRASNLLGKTIYNLDLELDRNQLFDADDVREWDDIGEVEDVILNRDGSVQAVVLSVGGFLGIGDKSVAVDMNSLNFVESKDEPGEYFLAVRSSAEELGNAPAYDQSMEPVEEDLAMMLEVPEINYDGYTRTEVSQLTARELENSYVYGSDNETVGEIDELLLDAEGKLEKAVINVGGFLGMSERPVAVGFNRLTILRQDGGDELRVYIDSTEEKLEQLPVYGG